MGNERLRGAVANGYGKEAGRNGSDSVLDLLFIPIRALIEHVAMARWRGSGPRDRFLTGSSGPRFLKLNRMHDLVRLEYLDRSSLLDRP